MVYYKKRYNSRRSFRKRGLYRRRCTMRSRRPRRVPRLLARSNTVYFKVARWQTTNLISFGGQINYNVSQFTVSTLSDIAAFQSLYDQYKITKIVMRFRAVSNMDANYAAGSASIGNAANVYPDIVCTVDHDDITTPTSVDQLLQYAKSKSGVLKPNTWWYYSFHPTPNMPIYKDGVTWAYGVAPRRLWLDVANSDIPHYGLKWIVDTRVAPTGQSFNYEIQYKIHAIFKMLR